MSSDATLISACLLALASCGDGGGPAPGPDAEPDVAAAEDASGLPDGGAGADATGDAAREPGPSLAPPVADPEVAARAFRLYYRERVERAVTAHQRYHLFGDVGFAAAIDKAFVKKCGSEIEVVAGLKDNNLIGTSVWTTMAAWRTFRTRPLELALVRSLRGLAYLEAIPGHPGLTAREVQPGWTRVVDGVALTVSRTRAGTPFSPPWTTDPALEAEIVDAFWGGLHVTYREDPAEFLFSFAPAAELTRYAKTHSFDMSPDYLRVSNCCSSLKRTPEGYDWAGAWWGNHNSRDNFPDLALGFLAAIATLEEPQLSPELESAAVAARDAGRRVGDLVLSSGSNVMTVDEWSDYGTLTVSGTIRPHGEPEAQDLGSFGACPMVYLAQAISTGGLALPVPALPLPGGLEALLASGANGDIPVDCPVPEGLPKCEALDQAWCGLTWGTLDELKVLGVPFLDLVRGWDEDEPGKAAELLGGWQNDFDDVVEAMVAVVLYARIAGDEALEESARAVVRDMTDLLRTLGDLAWAKTSPEQAARQRYEAAIFDALAGHDVVESDLGGFEIEETRLAQLDAAYDLPDTAPAPLKDDATILAEVEADLAGEKLEAVVQRYRDAYDHTPPVRRAVDPAAGHDYEARGVPEDVHPWMPVETPAHVEVHGLTLLQALPLCETAPDLLDCTWAKAGCAAADLDGNGVVDEADRAALLARAAPHPLDVAFLDAAQGCRR